MELIASCIERQLTVPNVTISMEQIVLFNTRFAIKRLHRFVIHCLHFKDIEYSARVALTPTI